MHKVPLSQPGKSVVALAVTASAGFVDAACWLVLFHVFVANLTGNFVSFAIGGASHDVGRMLRGGLAVAEFLVGAIAGRLAMRLVERRGVASAASVPLGMEVALLGAFALLARHGLGPPGTAAYLLLAALPALAMGAQNVTLRKVGPYSFYTTHVTGTVTRLAESLSDALTWDRESRDRLDDLRRAGFMAALLGFFAVGALLGVWLESTRGAAALAVPAAAQLLVIAVDQVRPLVTHPGRAPFLEHEELPAQQSGREGPPLPG